MKELFSEIRGAVISTLILAVVCCGIYPLIIWGIGQTVFPDKANGSLIRDASGTVRGSTLLAQNFSAENVDYECVERTNRFLVLHGGVWHAVTFSDTALMIKAVDELQEEISRAIRNCECGGSEPLPGK